jgi:hypothetical protein
MIFDDENTLIEEASEKLTNPFLFLIEFFRDKGNFLNKSGKLDNLAVYDTIYNMLKAICSQDTTFDYDKFHIAVFKDHIVIYYDAREILSFSVLNGREKFYLNTIIAYYDNIRGRDMYDTLMKIYGNHLIRKLGASYNVTSIVISVDK